MRFSDVCLSIAYIGPKSRTERTRTPLSSQKVKVLQAALLSTALTRVRRFRLSPWEGIRRAKVLLRCVCSAAREALGRQRGRRGAGAYCHLAHSLFAKSKTLSCHPTFYSLMCSVNVVSRITCFCIIVLNLSENFFDHLKATSL